MTLAGGINPPGVITGTTIGAGAGPAPIVEAGTAVYTDTLCGTPAAPGSLTGTIVLCQRGIFPRAVKSKNVAAGGAVGMILYNAADGDSLDIDEHWVPSLQITAGDGNAIHQWLVANGPKRDRHRHALAGVRASRAG